MNAADTDELFAGSASDARALGAITLTPVVALVLAPVLSGLDLLSGYITTELTPLFCMAGAGVMPSYLFFRAAGMLRRRASDVIGTILVCVYLYAGVLTMLLIVIPGRTYTDPHFFAHLRPTEKLSLICASIAMTMFLLACILTITNLHNLGRCVRRVLPTVTRPTVGVAESIVNP